MNQEFIIDQSQILSHKKGGVGVVTLNRPEALNALSLEMIRQIAVTLKQWEYDDSVHTVMFCGAGERAFCSGGDVKSFYNSGMDYRRGGVDLSVPSLYFAEEYSLNQQIFYYPKPTITIVDGIVMGGGYGIAGHCKHRFVTENAVFAMPEVRIGFFPDVGSIYHLNKAPKHFGRYLALTGAQIGAADILAANLADHYVPSARVGGLIEAIADGDFSDGVQYDAPAAKNVVLDVFSSQIEEAFADWDVFEICARLRQDGSEWATQTLGDILSSSPISVVVTARYMQGNGELGFDEIIAADYQMAQHFVKYPDLYEGIRAALIDKDKSPVWEPIHLDAVKPEDVERYFVEATYHLKDEQIFTV